MLSNISPSDALLSCGLAFVGGYGDAASFILAKSFTGHVTGNVVLGAIAIAPHQWRTALQHLSARRLTAGRLNRSREDALVTLFSPAITAKMIRRYDNCA